MDILIFLFPRKQAESSTYDSNITVCHPFPLFHNTWTESEKDMKTSQNLYMAFHMAVFVEFYIWDDIDYMTNIAFIFIVICVEVQRNNNSITLVASRGG